MKQLEWEKCSWLIFDRVGRRRLAIGDSSCGNECSGITVTGDAWSMANSNCENILSTYPPPTPPRRRSRCIRSSPCRLDFGVGVTDRWGRQPRPAGVLRAGYRVSCRVDQELPEQRARRRSFLPRHAYITQPTRLGGQVKPFRSLDTNLLLSRLRPWVFMNQWHFV